MSRAKPAIKERETKSQILAAVAEATDRPIILYVGSALFQGSPSEAAFVLRWIAALRASGHSAVRDASILVRPHPGRASRPRRWRGT